MRWAQRLQRVFGIEIEACARCGGGLKVIASSEDPALKSSGAPAAEARPRVGSLAAGARIDGVDGGMHGPAGVAEQG